MAEVNKHLDAYVKFQHVATRSIYFISQSNLTNKLSERHDVIQQLKSSKMSQMMLTAAAH